MFFSELKVPSTYYLIDTFKKLVWVHRELMNSDEFAFDIETNYPTTDSKPRVLEWRKTSPEGVCGVAYAWGRKQVERPWKPGCACYIPLLQRDDSPYWGNKQDDALALIKELQESDIPKVAHNGKFDCTKFRKLLKIATKKFVWDTMLAHSLVDEDCRVSRHALKSKYDKHGKITSLGMSDAYLDIGTSQFKADLDDALVHYDPALKRYSKVPMDILYPYGCADADMTLSLRYVMQELLDAEGLTWNFDNVLMPLQHRLMLMEMAGVPLDIERAKQVEAEQRALLESLSAEIHALTGKVFNVSSTEQLGEVLFDQMGLLVGGGKAQRNKKGWVIDSAAIQKLDHPVKEPLLKYRRAEQIHGMYAVASLAQVKEITHEGRIGWIHTDYYIPSRTGRLRSNDPNLSQLPKTEKGGDIVKGMYCCPGDYRFVFMDESQIELRVIAHLSQEPVWIDGFNAGHDMHAAMAIKAFGLDCDIAHVPKEMRSRAKTVNFGIAYGRSEGALAEELGMTYEEAYKFIHEDYFGNAPVLKGWIDDVHAFAEANGYVNTIFNRRRHLPDAQVDPPKALPWPDKSNLPSCYRKGPYLAALDIDPKDMYDIPDYQIKEKILKSPTRQFHHCLGCPYVKSCIVNRERKYVISKKNEALRQAVNSPVQGSAVEMVSLCAVWIGQELERQKLDSRLVLHIHDELGCIAHVDDVEATAKIMNYYMTEYLREYTAFSVPFVADPKICQRWSQK